MSDSIGNSLCPADPSAESSASLRAERGTVLVGTPFHLLSLVYPVASQHCSMHPVPCRAKYKTGYECKANCSVQVATLNHYAFLPDRPLGEATIDLRSLPKSGNVVDLQLRDVHDRERPLMASVSFHLQLQ